MGYRFSRSLVGIHTRHHFGLSDDYALQQLLRTVRWNRKSSECLWTFSSQAIIHFRHPIKVQLKRSLREQPDIHAKLMAKYPEGAFVVFSG